MRQPRDEFGSGLPAEGLESEVENPEPLDYPAEFECTPLLLKTDFRFDGRISTTQTIILADGVDTTALRVGALAMLVHLRSGLSTSANFDVRCHNVSYTPEDPHVTFVDNSRMVGLSTIMFGTLPPAGPVYEVIPVVQPVGPMMRVSLVFRQGATAAASLQTVSLSLYLLSRTRQ